MDALILKNEKVRAVGNMNVNARGDVLDSQNNAVASRNEQVKKQYQKELGDTVTDAPVTESLKSLEDQPVEPEEVIEGFDTVEIDDEEPEVKGGLASAIAKAQEKK